MPLRQSTGHCWTMAPWSLRVATKLREEEMIPKSAETWLLPSVPNLQDSTALWSWREAEETPRQASGPRTHQLPSTELFTIFLPRSCASREELVRSCTSTEFVIRQGYLALNPCLCICPTSFAGLVPKSPKSPGHPRFHRGTPSRIKYPGTPNSPVELESCAAPPTPPPRHQSPSGRQRPGAPTCPRLWKVPTPLASRATNVLNSCSRGV